MKIAFECSKCEKKIEIYPEFYVLKFSNLFGFHNNDLEKFVLTIIKGVICYEEINSWENLTKNHIQQKKFFSELNNK